MVIGKRKRQLLGVFAAAVVACTANSALAGSISANFCSVANVQNPPAGLFERSVWNDLTAAAGFGGFDSSSSILYESGLLSGTTVTWGGSAGVSQNTNDDVDRPGDIDDGHDEMMSGYLQASKFGPVGYVPTLTLEVSNIDVSYFGGSYDVILYFDGNGDVEGPNGMTTFSASDGINSLPTYYGRDPGNQYALLNDGSNPLSWYTPITSTDSLNPTVGGNYVIFTGLTGSTFNATLSGIANQQGAALNGFQIVPEPTTLVLLCSGALLLIRRR